MSTDDIKLVYNEPGLITENESWCIIAGGYLYGPCDTPEEVVWDMIVGWEHDSNIVG